MGLHFKLFILLTALFFDIGDTEKEPASFCQCACENRVAVDKDCITIFSVKTGGYLTADEHYPFTKYYERYVFVTNNNRLWQTAKWKVTTIGGSDRTYALKNEYVKEWLHAGSNEQARNAYKRYALTKIRGNENLPPRDGFWQFIPDPKIGKDVYRIRNSYTGEYLLADDETHYQRHDYNRAYLYRQLTEMYKTDNSYWFKIAKC